MENLEVSYIIRDALNLYLEDILYQLQNNNRVNLNIKEVIKDVKIKDLVQRVCYITKNQQIALL